MEAGSIAIDAVVGDEKRAGETIVNALSGRPVSASAAADAAITIGSDLLMFVPGIGLAAVAAKAARGARTASRAAKTAQQVSKLTSQSRNLHSAHAASQRGTAVKFTQRDAKKMTKIDAKIIAKKDAMKKAEKKLGIKQKTPATEATFRRKQSELEEVRKNARTKRNSPKRKKMRRTGNIISTTKDIQDFARAYDEEE